MVKKAHAFCFAVLFLTFLAITATHASAAENATLIVYVEAQNGDGTFSFTGSPTPLGSFQIDTSVNGSGGAQIFDVPAGNYTITASSLPAGWALQEIFCGGTGNSTVVN
jgi:hypothetical protein